MEWLKEVLRIGRLNLELKESQRLTAKRCKTSLRNVNICVRLTKMYQADPDVFKKCTSKRQAIRILEETLRIFNVK